MLQGAWLGPLYLHYSTVINSLVIFFFDYSHALLEQRMHIEVIGTSRTLPNMPSLTSRATW